MTTENRAPVHELEGSLDPIEECYRPGLDRRAAGCAADCGEGGGDAGVRRAGSGGLVGGGAGAPPDA